MKTAMVIPYVGQWPAYFPLFAKSCERNPSLTFLILSEKPPQQDLPANLKWLPMSLAEIHQRLFRLTGIRNDNLGGHKLCDLRPFYGLLFADLLEKYTHWGFCDIDVMFGDLSRLTSDPEFQQADVFTAHHDIMAGHFSLLRNKKEVNEACYQIKNWREKLQGIKTSAIDEEPFMQALASQPHIKLMKAERFDSEIKKKYCRHAITFTFQGHIADTKEKTPPLVKWDDGRVWIEWLDGRVVEGIYVHFMAIKHWWHWSQWGIRDNTTNNVNYFSRIGFGKVKKAGDLISFKGRLIYHLQNILWKIKVSSGRNLRKVFSEKRVRNIKRWARL